MNGLKYFIPFLFILSAIVSIRLFNFVYIPERLFDYGDIAVIGGLISMFLLSLFWKKTFRKATFTFYVFSFMFFPLISCIPAAIANGQPIISSLIASRVIFYWFLYFVLLEFKPNVRTITNILIIVGTLWAVFNIIQQFTFPNIYFQYNINFDEVNIAKTLETRGVVRNLFLGYRFTSFVLILLFFQIFQYKTHRKTTNYFLFFICMMGVFLSGTRQVLISHIFVFLWIIFFEGNFSKRKVHLVLGSLLFMVGFGFTFGETVINRLITLTINQSTTQEFQRITTINFFLLEFWPDSYRFLAYLFGNGWELQFLGDSMGVQMSSYGQELQYLSKVKGISRGDIGLIGSLNKFGVVYFLIVISFYIKVFFKKTIPSIYKYFFLIIFITSWTGKPFFEFPPTIVLFSAVLYLMEEKHLSKTFLRS